MIVMMLFLLCCDFLCFCVDFLVCDCMFCFVVVGGVFCFLMNFVYGVCCCCVFVRMELYYGVY